MSLVFPLRQDPREVEESFEHLERRLFEETEGCESVSREGWTLLRFPSIPSPTLNRVADVRTDPGRIGLLLEEACDFFGERGLPWSIQVTDRTTPHNLADLVPGFQTLRAWTIMVRPPTPPPSTLAGIEVVLEEGGEDLLEDLLRVTYGSFRLPQGSFGGLRGILRSWIGAGGRIVLARRGETPIGCGLYVRLGPLGTIYNVGVLPHFRRKGVASLLVGRILEIHESEGGGFAVLQVEKGHAAERLWRRMGFFPIAEWRFLEP